MQNPLRGIPSVNELLDSPPLKRLVNSVSHNVVISGVRTFLEDLRSEVQAKAGEFNWPASNELAQRIAEWIQLDDRSALRPVINATGILLHTGLGRAPLAQAAVQAVAALSTGYSSVEIDLETGERSDRIQAVRKLLKQLTGAEDALVVNNNAAATWLTLSALATDREVIVSRGQLIEIGGSFRLPDVMTASGARLREVGTTNKTKVTDYESAVSDQTGAILRAHTSNYRVIGFTEEVSLAELVALGRRHRIPVVDDIGSGALVDFGKYGVTGEPLVRDSVEAGVDVVLFSGDKLLGGPQAGIIVGRRTWIERIASHPIMRAVRVDKMVLAALAATLRLYRDEPSTEKQLPLLALLATSVENLQHRAERIAPQIAATPGIAQAEVVEGISYLGGGSVPMQQLATRCIAVTPKEMRVDALAKELRLGEPAVIGRVKENRLLLDLRSVFPFQDMDLVSAFERIGKGDKNPPEGKKGDSVSP